MFRGWSIGAEGESQGEVVFNTAMTGYQEILTDPSYCRQIVTLTVPHVGNTGANREDYESDRVYAAGLIIRDLPVVESNWRKDRPFAISWGGGHGGDRRGRYSAADAHSQGKRVRSRDASSPGRRTVPRRRFPGPAPRRAWSAWTWPAS